VDVPVAFFSGQLGHVRDCPCFVANVWFRSKGIGEALGVPRRLRITYAARQQLKIAVPQHLILAIG
jgi:hypothetical protein